MLSVCVSQEQNSRIDFGVGGKKTDCGKKELLLGERNLTGVEVELKMWCVTLLSYGEIYQWEIA